MISTPMLLFGPSFLTLWVGAEIAARATPVFLVLTIVGAVNTMAVSVLHNLNAGIGRMRSFTGYGGVSALVLTVMCALLVRPFGIMGAALGMLSTNVVDLIYMLTTLRRGLSMPLLRGLREMYFRPILVGVLVAVPGYLVREWSATWIGLLLLSAAFCAAYIGVSWIVGVFGESEKQMIKAMAPRWIASRTSVVREVEDGAE
jgi:O-antigen/teichoic acid export membrane protein